METPPESLHKDEALATIGQRIYDSFILLEEAARSHEYEDSFSSALVNQFQRFGLWAKNLGLYDLGHSSLDYRFRDAPTVHEYTRKLLNDLEKFIHQIEQEVDRPHSGWAVAAEQPNCHRNPSNQIVVEHTEFDMDKGSDGSSENEETLMSYQEESISSIVLENIRLIIDRLYKLAFQIRNPATRMGLSKARDYRGIDQDTGVDIMECYAFFDLRHLVEKAAQSGNKSQEECESNYLIQRLARANTDRRRQFAHWRRHKLKLDNAAKAVAVPRTLSSSHQGSEKIVISQPSTATGLDESNVNLVDMSSVYTSSSYGILDKEDHEDTIKIPPLPQNYCSGDAFECPFCFILCSKRVSETIAWERHVLRDLRPYICTYQNCPEGDLQYDNIKDWVSHEKRAHLDTQLQRADNSEQYPEDHRQSQPSNVITPNEISRQECPLCLVKNPTFVHIGRHLQEVAVFALPISMGLDEDSTLEDRASNIANIDNQDSMSDWGEFEDLEEDHGHKEKIGIDRNEGGARTSSDIVHFEKSQRDDVQHLTLTFQQLGKTTASGPDIEAYITGLEPDQPLLDGDRATNTRPSPTIVTARISFYVRLDPLVPDYEAQPARHGDHGYWAPPNIRTGYTRRPGYTFRWMNGHMTLIGPNDPIGRSLDQPYSIATVFTQNPDTPHLFVVPFDAQRLNVIEYPGGWRPLVFNHIRLDSTRMYSAVSANGDRKQIAAPGLAHWMPQLLPPVYDYQMGSVRVQAGLIGSLPLLIALAAFSAPPNVLVGTLTNCIQPMAWRPHQFQYPAGHVPERGMVVTVYFDPTNPQGSNAGLLNKLQNGEFGPFYN